jgi:hypothetical protein
MLRTTLAITQTKGEDFVKIRKNLHNAPNYLKILFTARRLEETPG